MYHDISVMSRHALCITADENSCSQYVHSKKSVPNLDISILFHAVINAILGFNITGSQNFMLKDFGIYLYRLAAFAIPVRIMFETAVFSIN